MANPYAVLGVQPNMSLKDIRSKYLILAKKYHPDGSNGNAEKFKEIHDAWEVIKSGSATGILSESTRLTHVTLFNFRRVKE